jgi:hypothetical protein
MKVIGKQMAAYILETKNNFREDLVDARCNDLLVTNERDVIRIQKQLRAKPVPQKLIIYLFLGFAYFKHS